MAGNSELENLAATLRVAQQTRTPCAQLSEAAPDLTVEDAYAIQRINIEKRLVSARLVGHKIGLTSEAVQTWLGVCEPDFGCLLDEMVVADAGSVDVSQLLQPRAEGEVAFVLGRGLKGPGVTAAHVIAATDFVLPAIEIIDSRIADWKITYEDTIADNASSGLFVLGNRPSRLFDVDLTLAGCTMRKNGAVVSTGVGVACLGHPINAVVWLANKLGELGVGLEAGHIILSGALGPVTPVEAGDWITVEIAHLGSVSVRFKGPAPAETEAQS